MERQKNGTTSCTVTLPKHIKQHKLYQFIFCFYVWFFFFRLTSSVVPDSSNDTD